MASRGSPLMVASLYLGFDNVNPLDQETKKMSASGED